jgi:hypothetical protein
VIEVPAGSVSRAIFETFTSGIAGEISAQITGPGAGDVFLPRTAPGAGVIEEPAGSGNYARDFAWPAVVGARYFLTWDRANGGALTPDNSAVEEIVIRPADWVPGAPAPAPLGPAYAAPSDLRAELDVDEAALSDDAAERLLRQAEDLVDELVGWGVVDEASGRLLVMADLHDWQGRNVRDATVAIAATLHRDPAAFHGARYSSVSGPDFSRSGPIAGGVSPVGRDARRRAARLLARAGLRVTGARATP